MPNTVYVFVAERCQSFQSHPAWEPISSEYVAAYVQALAGSQENEQSTDQALLVSSSSKTCNTISTHRDLPIKPPIHWHLLALQGHLRPARCTRNWRKLRPNAPAVAPQQRIQEIETRYAGRLFLLDLLRATNQHGRRSQHIDSHHHQDRPIHSRVSGMTWPPGGPRYPWPHLRFLERKGNILYWNMNASRGQWKGEMMSYSHELYAAGAVPPNVKTSPHTDIAIYHHRLLGFPPTSTLLIAIRKHPTQCVTFTGLTYDLITYVASVCHLPRQHKRPHDINKARCEVNQKN